MFLKGLTNWRSKAALGAAWALLCVLPLTSCDSKFSGSVANSNKRNNPLAGVVSVEGSISFEGASSSALRASEGCTDVATVYMTLFARWDGNKFAEVQQRLTSVKADADNTYFFGNLDDLGIDLNSKTDVWKVEAERCGEYFSRIITGRRAQDLSSATTAIDFAVDRTLLTASLDDAVNKKLPELDALYVLAMKSPTSEKIVEEIKSDRRGEKAYGTIFGSVIVELEKIEPRILSQSVPTKISATHRTKFEVQAVYFSTKYAVDYQWRLNGVDVGSEPIYFWRPRGNQIGPHKLELTVGIVKRAAALSLQGKAKLADPEFTSKYFSWDLTVQDAALDAKTPVISRLSLANQASDGFINNADSLSSSPVASLSASNFDNALYALVSASTVCDESLSYPLTEIPAISSVAANGNYKLCAMLSLTDGGQAFAATSLLIRDTEIPIVTHSTIFPAVGSPEKKPTLIGTVSKSSMVTLYYDASCASGKSEAWANTVFASPGIRMRDDIPNNVTTKIYAKAIDTAGNPSECKELVSYVHDDILPTVAAVSSTANSGGYKAGANIPITIKFSEIVKVTGVPQLRLATGGSQTILSYLSGDNTDTLTFVYTVASGEQANPLEYDGRSALGLNGGTILDLVGNAANLQLPGPGSIGSLSNSKQFIIDTQSPTFSYSTISPSVASSSRTPTVYLSLSEAAVVTLYSNSSCSAAISNAASLQDGPGQTVTTNNLSQNSVTTIYAQAVDAVGNKSSCGNVIVYTHDDVLPSVVSFGRAAGQMALTNSLPVNFRLIFSEPINPSSFTTNDIANAGTATGIAWTITDSGDRKSFTIQASAANNGTIIPQLSAGAITDPAANTNSSASTASNSVGYSVAPLTVTINQAASQID
ncbi:MAG: hypothetical protein WCL28_11650, partial [bacterium]